MGTQRHCLPELTWICWPPYSYSQLLFLPINVKDTVSVWFLRLWYHVMPWHHDQDNFSKTDLFGLTVPGDCDPRGQSEGIIAGTGGCELTSWTAGWSKECAQEMAGVCKLSETASSEVRLLSLPKTAPPTGGQALKYPRLWEIFLIQATAKVSIKMVMPQ